MTYLAVYKDQDLRDERVTIYVIEAESLSEAEALAQLRPEFIGFLQCLKLS